MHQDRVLFPAEVQFESGDLVVLDGEGEDSVGPLHRLLQNHQHVPLSALSDRVHVVGPVFELGAEALF